MEMNLIVEEAVAPYLSNRFPGKLYLARPSKNKPREVSDEEWRDSILQWAKQVGGKWAIAIPASFWPKQREVDEAASSHGCVIPHIRLMDMPGEVAGGETPENSIGEIIRALMTGQDVMILSGKEKVSGFMPAILGALVHPECHPEKLFWPVLHQGYELTPAQMAYITALYDSERLGWLEVAHYGESEPSEC